MNASTRGAPAGIIRRMKNSLQSIPVTGHRDAPEVTVRPATLDDIAAIDRLLKDYATKGKLLSRPETDLYQSLREFVVVTIDQQVIGCAALQIFTRQLGEIRSLAVQSTHAGMGLGSKLVQSLEKDALRLGLWRLMALTYEVRFFEKLGYGVVEMKVLPEKVWGACINCPKFRNCDEIAVLKHLQTGP